MLVVLIQQREPVAWLRKRNFPFCERNVKINTAYYDTPLARASPAALARHSEVRDETETVLRFWWTTTVRAGKVFRYKRHIAIGPNVQPIPSISVNNSVVTYCIARRERGRPDSVRLKSKPHWTKSLWHTRSTSTEIEVAIGGRTCALRVLLEYLPANRVDWLYCCHLLVKRSSSLMIVLLRSLAFSFENQSFSFLFLRLSIPPNVNFEGESVHASF